MTLTLTNYPFRDRFNDRQSRHCTLTGPASYTTGGETVSAANDFGLSDVYTVDGIVGNGSAVRLLRFDRVNQKLQYFIPDTGVEVDAATNLSGFTGEIIVTGK